ncbi:hypothetical protein BaRGS_00028648 [Batillaria attramentaria]|uniref:Uncharacterized protein n=1 Tax=Batillaria attramentaria TaxID=370345 RepID=A0ABD0JZT0_9CAEN
MAPVHSQLARLIKEERLVLLILLLAKKRKSKSKRRHRFWIHPILRQRRSYGAFFHLVRREKKMPEGLDRADKKCGNVGLPGVSGWIRALCDADGDTPCCYDNVCVNKSTEQCKCSNCVDLRQVIHAEHATWRPDDPSCQMQQMSVKEMCQLLGGVRLYFIGDSLVRQLYTAFLLALRGNEMTGALRDDTPKNVTAACTGLYMFTEKLCKHWVNTTATVCDGRVWLKLFSYNQVRHAKSIRGAVVQMNNSGRGIVLMGFGIHERLNFTAVQTRILAPLMKIPQLDVRRLVWLAIHCPGLMKAPHRGQGPDDVLSFNRNLTQFWSAYNVAIFDSFNMTDGVTSFDGTHYGLGVNRAKVQVLMHYFRTLAAQRLW